MAIIQKIRNRAGILVSVIIGLALLAFILGDFLTSGSAYFSDARSNIVEINGKGVSYQTFDEEYKTFENEAKERYGKQSLTDEETEAIREETYNTIVFDKVFGREFDKLGLAVNKDELDDLLGGQHLSPFVIQLLQSQNTDLANWKRYLSSVREMQPGTPEMNFYVYIEDQVYKNRIMTKYSNLIKQGTYVTGLEAKRRLKEISNEVNFSYIVDQFDAADSAVSVTNSELKDYYKEHLKAYKQEASRDIRFVYWEVIPSQADYAAAEKEVKDMITDLSALDAQNSIEYINANSDVKIPAKRYTKGELKDSIIDAFAFSSPENSIYGPYFEENQFKAAKVIKAEFLPDSVRASHIIIPISNENYAKQRVLADSLKKMLENGADMTVLASSNSYDENTKSIGGDLGWFKEGKFPPIISDSCFYGKTGDVRINILAEQGALQIIKITGQSTPVKKVQVGLLNCELRPSESTDAKYRIEASKFGTQNNTPEKFEAALKTGNYKIVPVNNLRPQDKNVADLERSRELVMWAFKSDEKTITDRIYTYGNKHVVAIVDKVREKGYTPFEDLKKTIEIEVKKEKQSATIAAKLKEASAGASSLSAIASKLSTDVKTASNIRFASYQIPGVGFEPKLLGAVMYLPKGKISKPIEGTNGVYIFQVDSEIDNSSTATPDIQKRYLENNYYSRINYSLMDALYDLSKLEDFRYKFF